MLDALQEPRPRASASRASTLVKAALRLASRDGGDLVLPLEARLPSVVCERVAASLTDARDVLVLGASTPGLAAQVVERSRARGHSARVVESDERLLDGVCQLGDLTDLRIDARMASELVSAEPIADYQALRRARSRIAELAAAFPWIADACVDVVVLDLLANRLAPGAFAAVLEESLRVLRRGGRLDLVALLADEEVRGADETYWGRVALSHWPVETALGRALELAGFHGIAYELLSDGVVRVTKGSELRAFVLTAYKGKQGACLDCGHAVIYRGPWREVHDDDDHRYVRGERTAVCAKTFELLMQAPYRGQFVGIEPHVSVPADAAPPFDCNAPLLRSPAVTKGRVPQPPPKAGCC